MNLIGKSFKNRYYITSKLGEGGMAEVYIASDAINKREVAIKIIKDSTLVEPSNVARFQREARASAALRHQNIIEIYDVDEYYKRPYMVMEYVKGETLKDILKKRGTFTVVEATDIISQLSAALIHAHEHGVIHRDIKPQNVLLRNDGQVKLGDFGIALVNDAPHLTQKDIVLGSVPYLSEENIEEPVKMNVLNILHDMYGLTEDDFISAEIEIVPARKDGYSTIRYLFTRSNFL